MSAASSPCPDFWQSTVCYFQLRIAACVGYLSSIVPGESAIFRTSILSRIRACRPGLPTPAVSRSSCWLDRSLRGQSSEVGVYNLLCCLIGTGWSLPLTIWCVRCSSRSKSKNHHRRGVWGCAVLQLHRGCCRIDEWHGWRRQVYFQLGYVAPRCRLGVLSGFRIPSFSDWVAVRTVSAVAVPPCCSTLLSCLHSCFLNSRLGVRSVFLPKSVFFVLIPAHRFAAVNVGSMLSCFLGRIFSQHKPLDVRLHSGIVGLWLFCRTFCTLAIIAACCRETRHV